MNLDLHKPTIQYTYTYISKYIQCNFCNFRPLYLVLDATVPGFTTNLKIKIKNLPFYQYCEILRKTFDYDTHTDRVTLICQVTASCVRKIECLNSASETFLVLQTTIRRPKKQENEPDVSIVFCYQNCSVLL